MQILFVHQNFPAQFGHIAHHLARSRGWRCDFVTEATSASLDGVRTIPYQISGGVTRDDALLQPHVRERRLARPRRLPGVRVRARPRSRPDRRPQRVRLDALSSRAIPGRAGGELLRAFLSSARLRPRLPSRLPSGASRLPPRPNAQRDDSPGPATTAALGYSPTHYQKGLFPAEYQPKIDVIFDGIETEVFHRRANVPRRVGSLEIPESTRIVTYVSRGFESMRGFDIFMRAARLIYREHPDVLFVVVGSDRICYGGDEKHIRHRTFREHVLAQDDYDMSKFIFTGLVPTDTLVDLLSLSDLHIYLTVPFVLSWSLMNALACGCVVLASDTEPVREVIVDGETGLLAGFFDVEAFARRALDVLRDPPAFRDLGDRAAAMIESRYALSVTLPRLVALFERATSRG